MFSRLRIGIFLGLLLLTSLACGLGSGGYEDYAGEPSYDEEPADAEPTDLPLPSPSPLPTATLATTLIPVTGGPDPELKPTPMAVSVDLNTVYARVVEELPKGSALFNPPEKMRVGEAKVVEVRVVPMTEDEIEQDEQIRATLTADLEEVDEIVVIPLRVSTVMSASLSGTAFTIDPLTQEEQIRTIDDLYLSWQWEVRPEKSGEQRLTLFLSVVVNAEGMGDKTHTITENRTIQVQANPIYSLKQFFGTNWEWVATGLLLPAIGWAWRRFRGARN